MESIVSISIEDLLLDELNPRIYGEIVHPISQLELAEYLYKTFGIGDLTESFKKNGYFPVEPMVAIPSGSKFIVVEGNRRLATIKILCDDLYRNNIISVGKREEYKVNDEIKNKLKELPVVVVENRDSVVSYLGVRHLGGVMKWDPLAQSKYVFTEINKTFLANKNEGLRAAIDSVILKSNKKKNEILNYFIKYKIYLEMLEVVQENPKLANTQIDSKFSLLEVAFGAKGNSAIAKYLGIKNYNDIELDNLTELIPEEKKGNLKKIIEWIFVENAPIIESREINKFLKPILANPISTKYFEEGMDKETALMFSGKNEEIFIELCDNVTKRLTNISYIWAKIENMKKQELLDYFKGSILEKVEYVKSTLNI